jgi:cell division protein FtsZ
MDGPTQTNPGQSDAQSTASLRVKLIAVGDGARSVVEALPNRENSGLLFAAVNTDANALRKARFPEKLCLATERTRGLGIGGDPELARLAAEEEFNKLQKLCDGSDLVIIVAGLGGGTGSGASPVIARAAKEAGAKVLAVGTLPFGCEGTRRRNQAHAGLQRLKTCADGVVCLSNERLLRLAPAEASIPEVYRLANDLAGNMIYCLSQILTHPGPIKLSFADLCAVLRGRFVESSFVTVEAAGENVAKQALEMLLASPVLEAGQLLARADGILVSVLGGSDLTMAQVDWLMTEIQGRSEHAQMVLGTALQDGVQKRLTVSMFVCRRELLEPAAGESPEEGLEQEEVGASRLLPEKGRSSHPSTPIRSTSRFIPPAPALTAERRQQILAKKGLPLRPGKQTRLARQGQLPLEIVSRGRFEKSEPTIHDGEDLDIPTYIRRGVPLN